MVSVMEHLISRGGDIDEPDRVGNTPLHHAVMTGATKAIEFLVKEGADLEKKNQRGETPHDVALRFNRLTAM